jgi:hypothetical protein
MKAGSDAWVTSLVYLLGEKRTIKIGKFLRNLRAEWGDGGYGWRLVGWHCIQLPVGGAAGGGGSPLQEIGRERKIGANCMETVRSGPDIIGRDGSRDGKMQGDGGECV